MVVYIRAFLLGMVFVIRYIEKLKIVSFTAYFQEQQYIAVVEKAKANQTYIRNSQTSIRAPKPSIVRSTVRFEVFNIQNEFSVYQSEMRMNNWITAQ